MFVPRRVGVSTLLLALWLAALPSTGAAQLRDRSVRWRTVNTEHFAVHYPAHLGPVARRAGYALERAHARVSPVVENEMSGRVQVTLSGADPIHIDFRPAHNVLLSPELRSLPAEWLGGTFSRK